MEITGKGTLYKGQYGWSITDNQKNQDGTTNKFYIPVQLRKELQEPADKSFVSIKGYTKPYKTKDNKLGISYLIMDYVVIGSQNSPQMTGTQDVKSVESVKAEDIEVDDPFSEFAEDNKDIELPF